MDLDATGLKPSRKLLAKLLWIVSIDDDVTLCHSLSILKTVIRSFRRSVGRSTVCPLYDLDTPRSFV
jgi:hypothetical protein